MYTRFTIILLLAVVGLAAIDVQLNDNQLDVQVLNTNPLTLRMQLGSFSYNEVDIDGQTWALPHLDGEGLIMDKGMPQLPKVVRSVIIPGNLRPDIVVTGSEETFVDLRVAPSKGHFSRNIDPSTVPYVFDDFYRNPTPQEIATLSDPYILRDYRGVAVSFQPFYYNPLEERLYIKTSIDIEIQFNGPATINPQTTTRSGISREFDEIYRNHFINLPTDRYIPLEDQGRMIIISYNYFMEEMEPFVNWKIQKGIQTDLYNVSDIGNTYTQIMDFIQQQYDQNDNLTWVLLVGDFLQVDSPIFSGGGADPMYALVDGNDSYPDLFIGRLSAQSESQVITQVDRLIHYERDITSGDWLSKGTGIASQLGNGQGDDGESDYVHMGYIRDDLLSYNYTQVDELYATLGATSTMVSNALNEGRTVVNYCGHGSTTAWGTTGFSYSNVNNLTNDNKLPFIISVACKNGNFTSYTCFAEYWMRATNNSNGNPTGAIGIYASSINQEWAPPMSAQDEIIDLLVSESNYTVGGLCYNGSCLMIDEYSYWGPRMYNTWHIFGDPSLVIRTMTPQAMNISHSTFLPLGSSSLTINTDTPGATVCLTAGQTIVDAAAAGATGSATLSFEPLTQPAELLLTVTAPDRIAYQETISVGEVQAVTGLSIDVASEGGVALTWNPVEGASGYNVYSINVPNGTFFLRARVAETSWSSSRTYEARFFYVTAVFE